MTYTLVVGAAPVSGCDAFYSSLLAGAADVVAADAAGEWCVALGRVPEVVTGDFDSAAPGAEDRLRALGSEVVAFPCDKDETDLDLAVVLARGRAGETLVVTAAFSLRPDHTLAAFGSLARAGAHARAEEPGWTAWVCTPGGDLVLDVRTGTTLSVLALEPATGVCVSGTAWPLTGASLSPLSGHGVSNRAIGGPVRVRTGSGTLIVLVLKEGTGEIY